ncbi:transcription initiation factor TFIID subunit 4-like isoform X2 [Colius striatus]|uniref:transcription initiation factor TFIID subunit 4-like isoform X2 n=1 Tax=Colius striatus TaxID=57412 RepID=UPI002B1D0024|nr:transcription initiation factor TFIID subunit 4-like isoform X2 [Colius striatus]
MAAGASDPLEEMLLFSEEVDEKAVSDLVGSLESQLAGGRGSAEAPQPRTSAPSQQQQPQQQHQGSLAGGSSPVRQQQGHPAPPPVPGAEEAGGCPGAAESRAPAQGPLPSPSPPAAAAAAAAAAAGRGVSVNSSSVQQSHGAALLGGGGGSPGAPAAPAPPQPAAPPPAGAPAQPVNNHVAAGAAARDAGSPSPGGSPPAADSAPSQRTEAAAAAAAGGSGTPAGGGGPAGAAEGATATAPLPGEAAPNGEGAGGRPAALPPVSSHGRADTATAQTKPAHGPLPAVNALSNSASPAAGAAAPPGQGSVANCAPPAPAAVAPGAAPKPAVSAAAVAKAGAALPVVPAAPQALSPRPALGAAPRIVAPQLIVRPPQQTTIQLPPGFTIPPGMVLVRTDAGQLVMVPQQALAQAQMQAQVQTQGQNPASISPRLSVPTTGPVFRLSTTQQPTSVATSTVRLGLPVQAKVVQSTATPVSATSAATLPGGSILSHTTVTVATTNAQNLFKTTVATGTSASQQPAVITGGQTQASAQNQGQPRLPLPPHTTAQVPAQPQVIPSSPVPGTTVVSQEMQENVKKCKNFLATLIKLASHNSPSPETSRNVKALVQDLLDAKIDPEEFTGRLQSELKSSPQPYLVPFLKKSLPALRQSLLNSQHSVLQGQPSQQSLQQTKLSQVIPQSASGSISSVVTTQTIGIRQPNNICTVSVSNTVQPPQVKVVQSNQSSQLIIQSTSAQTVKRNPACQTTQIRMPVVITQTIRPQGTVGKAPTIQASKSPGGFGVQVSANQKNKLNDPGGGSFRDDDDINDVASMAGVNLNEESARIMATNSDLVGTQIQSCKDEPFLAAIPLHKRILEMAKKLGITDVPAEVVTFISHATQNRLRTVIEKVTVITQHRMESYKDDEWYEQATDVRSQLKFFEQLERLEKQRKDEQEREILLKAAKSRSRQEDPEQARLKQKAKEMQQQELAQMRQRDANLTALAAIGPRKKRKLDSPGLLTVGGEGLGVSGGSQAGLGTPSSRQYARQKITRVNLRDFIFYLEQERETSHSLLLYRALLK